MAPAELERETRRLRINPRLEAANWNLKRFDPALPLIAYGQAAAEGFEFRYGPADYALCNDGGVVGVVGSQEGEPQRAGGAHPG